MGVGSLAYAAPNDGHRHGLKLPRAGTGKQDEDERSAEKPVYQLNRF
jgi:hypothetical protein